MNLKKLYQNLNNRIKLSQANVRLSKKERKKKERRNCCKPCIKSVLSQNLNSSLLPLFRLLFLSQWHTICSCRLIVLQFCHVMVGHLLQHFFGHVSNHPQFPVLYSFFFLFQSMNYIRLLSFYKKSW